MFKRGDVVEIISTNIYGDGRLKPGLRGIVRGEWANQYNLPVGCELRGRCWLVDFDHTDAVCEQIAIRKVPPDPGRGRGYWDQCPYKPPGFKVSS